MLADWIRNSLFLIHSCMSGSQKNPRRRWTSMTSKALA